MPEVSSDRPIMIVTGAAGGIGAELSTTAASLGWTVIGVDRSWPTNKPQGLTEALTSDVTHREQVLSLFDDVHARWGRLDCLVNSAGITRPAPASTLPLEDWELVLNVSLTGSFLMSQGAYPLLKQGMGSIVNLSSISAERVLPGRTAYSTAKAGVDAMTRSLAVEWAPDGVRVNAVAPAWVDSQFLRRLEAAGTLDPAELARRIPLGRLCSEADVAQSILFLADSTKSGFITGQVLYVDGGYLHAG